MNNRKRVKTYLMVIIAMAACSLRLINNTYLVAIIVMVIVVSRGPHARRTNTLRMKGHIHLHAEKLLSTFFFVVRIGIYAILRCVNICHVDSKLINN